MNSVKGILAGICAGLLLLAMAQVGISEANVPTWQVGDTWAMGASNIDLAPLIQYIEQEIETMGGSADLTGTLSVYEIFKVVEVQATQYKVEISMGLEMNISGTMSVTQAGQTQSGSLNLTFTAKADGYAYFTKDTLALAKEELSGDMDLTMSMQADGQTVDITMDVSSETTITFDPPLDIFNFPITVDNSWTAESTATVTGTISGTVSMTGLGEQSISQPLDTTTSVSIPFQCPSTADVTLEDGSVSTCYKITQSGASVGGVTPTCLGGTAYYSPDKGFIVKQDLMGLPGAAGQTGEMSLAGVGSTASLGSINPVTVQEAESAIAGMGVGGIDIVLLAIIIGVVVAVVVTIVVVVFAIRRHA